MTRFLWSLLLAVGIGLLLVAFGFILVGFLMLRDML